MRKDTESLATSASQTLHGAVEGFSVSKKFPVPETYHQPCLDVKILVMEAQNNPGFSGFYDGPVKITGFFCFYDGSCKITGLFVLLRTRR